MLWKLKADQHKPKQSKIDFFQLNLFAGQSDEGGDGAILCFELWPRSSLKLAKCWKSHFMFMLPSIQFNDQMDHQLVYYSFSLSLSSLVCNSTKGLPHNSVDESTSWFSLHWSTLTPCFSVSKSQLASKFGKLGFSSLQSNLRSGIKWLGANLCHRFCGRTDAQNSTERGHHYCHIVT